MGPGTTRLSLFSGLCFFIFLRTLTWSRLGQVFRHTKSKVESWAENTLVACATWAFVRNGGDGYLINRGLQCRATYSSCSSISAVAKKARMVYLALGRMIYGLATTNWSKIGIALSLTVVDDGHTNHRDCPCLSTSPCCARRFGSSARLIMIRFAPSFHIYPDQIPAVRLIGATSGDTLA